MYVLWDPNVFVWADHAALDVGPGAVARSKAIKMPHVTNADPSDDGEFMHLYHLF